MTRLVFMAILMGVVGLVAQAQTKVEVAPAPREIREDGSRDSVTPPDIKQQENPLEVVERIIKNSNTVGDQLAMTDTGKATQLTQKTILADIDALINRQEDPPPPKNDQNPDQDNKDNKDNKDQEKPMDGKDNMPPKKDMSGMDPKEGKDGKDGMDQQPMGQEPPRGHRPRQPMGGQQQPQGSKPKDPDKNPMGNKQNPMGNKQNPMPVQPPQAPKNTGNMMPDPKGGPQSPSRPALPFEDDVVKDVWGHLPDKLRQQATQYYKQEFMPRYAELLKQYYASLSEKGEKK